MRIFFTFFKVSRNLLPQKSRNLINAVRGQWNFFLLDLHYPFFFLDKFQDFFQTKVVGFYDCNIHVASKNCELLQECFPAVKSPKKSCHISIIIC
jgi:hypothetical protein